MLQGPFPPDPRTLRAPERLAIAAAAVWGLLSAGLALAGHAGLVMLAGVILPAGLVWGWLVLARGQRVLAAQLAALEQQMIVAPQPPAPTQPPAAAKPAPPPAMASFAAARPKTTPAPMGGAAVQKVLPLDSPSAAEAPPLERPDLIRALHFPDNADDAAGFTALRRALRDHGARRLVQASQDVLTLLAQDGIYMDDLRPDPANADLWRRFAQGERGQSLDQLGAVRDPAVLALVGARMRQDTIFRDAVHHFLRLFDEFLVRFEQPATDTELLKLAETRTARAFMLLGRASRTFD